jgi:adenosylcobinamide-phosphate synthase
VTIPVAWALRSMPFGWVIEAILASSLLAQKSLGRAVRAVAAALARSLPEGRVAVSHIVGRDPERLDTAGVARAAIESLAESTSDGVVAPLFFLLLGGLPGIALYKAVNTADSMIGHKTERHLNFGWAAARFDDLLNLIPARLTALLVAGAAFFVKGAQPEAAWATALSDAKQHESPNAGWPEAAFAGALGYQLGGPRSYAGELVDLPSFGHGRADLDAADIERALRLYSATLNLVLAAMALVSAMLWRLG